MPDPAVSTSESELRPIVEQALSTGYELDREIGRGGMGIVYRAKDRRLKRHVAIKILPPELAFRSEIRTRFLREAETAAQLSHPNIVPIYSVDEAGGLVYFVMACVDGDNLGKRIHDRGPLPIADTKRILAEVADALAYAHARGVVHRDIKPDNILLDGDGRAMVTDFGIARAVIEGSDSRLTATGMAIGTPAFMSPEQSAGDREIDGRSDLYSLGVVAYQMLAGELPFQATSTPAMLVKHLSEIPMSVDQRRADVPRDLAVTVMRLLEKEPANRFASAEELEGVLRGTIAPPAPASYNTTRPAAAQNAPQNPATAPYSASYDAGYASAYSAPAYNAPPNAANYPARQPGAANFGALDGSQPFQPLAATGSARWYDPQVVAFRRKLGWFAIMGSVLLLVSIFGDSDFFTMLGLWAIYIAYKYAKLWSNGYDWRDVLRQPKDRLFADVLAEGADDVSALFDPNKRQRVRERERARAAQLGSAFPGEQPTMPLAARGGERDDAARLPAMPPRGGAGPLPPGADPFGAHAAVVREALSNRDEVLRLLEATPKAERAQIAEVGPSVEKLAVQVQSLAATIAELDRNIAPGAVAPIQAEIDRLEEQANPLDRAASEGRVKQLAYLKRQRRAIGDMSRRRDEAVAKLESCRLLLGNMRLDLLRLRTGGGGSYGQLTEVSERAAALARDVDAAVYAANEVRRI